MWQRLIYLKVLRSGWLKKILRYWIYYRRILSGIGCQSLKSFKWTDWLSSVDICHTMFYVYLIIEQIYSLELLDNSFPITEASLWTRTKSSLSPMYMKFLLFIYALKPHETFNFTSEYWDIASWKSFRSTKLWRWDLSSNFRQMYAPGGLCSSFQTARISRILALAICTITNAVLTAPYLTAITCVMLDGDLLGKPIDENQCFSTGF